MYQDGNFTTIALVHPYPFNGQATVLPLFVACWFFPISPFFNYCPFYQSENLQPVITYFTFICCAGQSTQPLP